MPSQTTGGRGAGRATPVSGALALRLFDQVLGGPSWRSWRSWLLAVFGLPMSESESAVYKTCTGRSTLPSAPAREVWNVVARRAGKSRMAGFLVAFLAGVKRWTLVPGERGIVQVITPSRAQASVILDYAAAFIGMLPGVEVTRQTQDVLELSTGISIVVQTASYRSPRGYTVVAAVCDEIAFWRSDDNASNPDVEILRAIRPSLASVPGSLLIALSSPYAQTGELFKTYEKHYGRDESDILVWKSDSRTMNPCIPQQMIDKAFEEDAASAAAEWGGNFRVDLESLFARDALDGVVTRGTFERAPADGISYFAFCDPSGGSADSMTLAIAHREASGGLPVLDLVRERVPPFSPESVVAEFVRELARYRIREVTGDAYAGDWVREAFRNRKIDYKVSELSRSELYLELLPLVNSGSLALLDNARLLGQLAGLERRVGRSGRDSIDHRGGAHDDAANAAAGAIVGAVRSIGAATLPETFKECWRAASIASFDFSLCYLVGGPFKPSGCSTCAACYGHTFVLAAKKAHQERTGEWIDLIEFYNSRIAGNDLTARVRASRWSDAMGL